MKTKAILAMFLLLCASVLIAFNPSTADFYEDFEGAQIDLNEWTIYDMGGLNGTQVGGELIVNGTYDPGETVPGTGGWNLYVLIYNRNYTGFVDFSVVSNITSWVGEMSVGIGIVHNTSELADNVTSWVQRFLAPTINAVGYMETWLSGSVDRLTWDDQDVVAGLPQHQRMIVHENRSAEFILNGATKGWWDITYPVFNPYILVAIHGGGATMEASFDDFMLVDSAPQAVLGASDLNPDVDEFVLFDGSQSPYPFDLEGYLFDFGDGESTGWISNSTAYHSYPAEGSYDARLKVRADNGKESEWASVTICVDCAVPVVEFSLGPLQVDTFEPVWFTANGSSDADGTIIGYLFDFGDGSTSGWIMDAYTSHSYEDDGVYDTAVKVLDDDGHETNWSSPISVRVDNQAPVAVLRVDTHVEVGEALFVDGSLSYDPDGDVVNYDIRIADEVHVVWSDIGYAVHKFDEAGVYLIMLSVRDNDGEESEAAQARIVVHEPKEEPLEPMWWIVIALLLIILLLVIVVLVLQWRLVQQREEAAEPPPMEDEGEPE